MGFPFKWPVTESQYNSLGQIGMGSVLGSGSLRFCFLFYIYHWVELRERNAGCGGTTFLMHLWPMSVTPVATAGCGVGRRKAGDRQGSGKVAGCTLLVLHGPPVTFPHREPGLSIADFLCSVSVSTLEHSALEITQPLPG